MLHKKDQLNISNDCKDFEREWNRKVLIQRRFDWADRRFWLRVIAASPNLLVMTAAVVFVLQGFLGLFPELNLRILLLVMFLIIVTLGYFTKKILERE